MTAVGGKHPFPETRLLAELLNHCHAADNFMETIVNIGQITAHPAHNRRAQPLIDPHHQHHRREHRGCHQRHPPLQGVHGNQHHHNQRHAAEQRRQHVDKQVFDHLRVIGDTGDQLPDRLGVKCTQRLAQCGIHHIGAQCLDHADSGLVEINQLKIVQQRCGNL